MPLDDMVKESGIDMAPYQGSDEGIRIGDQLYGLPFRNDYYVLYYNKTLFDKAGVEYPKHDMTWDEYRELAKKMTSGCLLYTSNIQTTVRFLRWIIRFLPVQTC